LAECGCSLRDGGESISTSRPAKRSCARGSITAGRLRWVIGTRHSHHLKKRSAAAFATRLPGRRHLLVSALQLVLAKNVLD
jgi:hypothetical protein